VAVLFQLVRTFLKMSKESTPDLFDTELFINERDRLSGCQSFGTPDRLLTAINKQKPTRWRHCTRNLLRTIFIYLAGCTMFPHLPAPIKLFDHYIIFFLQLFLSFQSSSINPFSPISPLIPSAQVSLGLPRFLLPGPPQVGG
jgi:hypothetical protein